MARTSPSISRGLILALSLGCAAGVGLGVAYRSLSSSAAPAEVPPPTRDGGPGKASAPRACTAPVLTAPTLESRARFMPGAKDTAPAIPEVKVKADGKAVSHGVRKLSGAPARRSVAFAFHFKSDIFKAPGKQAKIVGHARRGAVLPVARRLRGGGCKGGTWYELSTGGAVCTSRGFTVGVQPSVPNVYIRLPDERRPLFFSYARQKERGTPRLYRFPMPREEEEIAAARGRRARKAKAQAKAKARGLRRGLGRPPCRRSLSG